MYLGAGSCLTKDRIYLVSGQLWKASAGMWLYDCVSVLFMSPLELTRPLPLTSPRRTLIGIETLPLWPLSLTRIRLIESVWALLTLARLIVTWLWLTQKPLVTGDRSSCAGNVAYAYRHPSDCLSRAINWSKTSAGSAPRN